jgi:hypothetical protein
MMSDNHSRKPYAPPTILAEFTNARNCQGTFLAEAFGGAERHKKDADHGG